MFRLTALFALFFTATQVFSAPRGTLLESTLLGSYTKEQLNADFQKYGL